MARKKSSKQTTVQSKSESGHKVLTVVEFFTKAVTAICANNTAIALETGALPAPPKDKQYSPPARPTGDSKCPLESGKSGRRCGGNLVCLDTPKGPSTATEYAMCDKCHSTVRVAYVWVHQRFSPLQRNGGQGMPSLVKMFNLYVANSLVELPKEITKLLPQEQFVAAARFVTSPENFDDGVAPLQQRAVKGGYMFGVTDIVSHSGKQGRSQAATMSTAQVAALLDF